jgi:PEGA domain
MARRAPPGRRATATSVAARALVGVLIAGLSRAPVALAQTVPERFVPQVLAVSGPKVSVAVVGLDARARLQGGLLEAEAEAALARSGRFTLVPVQDALNPEAAKRRRAQAIEGRAKVEAGRTALDDLDNVKATESFVDALAAFKQADTTAVFKDLVEASVLKAAAHATGGEAAAAKKGIESAVALDPKAEFSPTYFPPELIKYADGLRRQVGRGDLTIRTEPAGGRVWVDGTYAGVSPVSVKGGKHLVSASASGFALSQTELSSGDELLTLEPSELASGWKKALAAVASDPEGPGRDSAGRELARAMGVDQLILVVVKKNAIADQLDLIAVRLDARDGHNWSYNALTVSLTKPPLLSTIFDQLLASDTPRDGKNPVTHYKSGSSFTTPRATLGFALLGLGVGAAVNGAIFGFMASDRASAFRQTRQTDISKSAQLKAQGQGFAVVADISFIVALASAAAGTVVLVTQPSGGSSEPAAVPAATDDSKRRRDPTPTEPAKAPDTRRRDDERRAVEAKQKEDERRRADSDAAAAKKADEERKRVEAEAAAKKAADDEEFARAKKTKKQQEDERKRKEDEKRQRDEEARAAEKKQNDVAAKKQPDPAAAEAQKKADDEAAKKADDERRKKEEEKRKKEEEDKKKKKKEEDHDDLRNY